MTDFISFGFKITVDDDCSHEIKRKAMTNRDSILESIYHFADKNLSSQNYGFSSSQVWMWEWTIKKAECWRTDAFKLQCWTRLLEISLTSGRSNQSNPKGNQHFLNIHWKNRCWSWNCKTLATLHEQLTHWKRPWCRGILKAQRRGQQRMRWLDGITNSVDVSLSKLL